MEYVDCSLFDQFYDSLLHRCVEHNVCNIMKS